jgi:AcrR family transcriptional regulator
VYRFFSNRQALILGLLEDLEAELVRRFDEVTSRPFEGGMHEVARRFVDAVCDAIEAKGRGPWELLGSKGPDPEAARLAKKIHTRLLAPWHAQIAAATGVSPRKAAVVSRMLVAAGRAALEEWYAGRTSRSEAAGDAARGVSALLVAFAEDG